MRAATALLCLVLVAACAEFPQIDAAVGTGYRDAPYPELAPMDLLLAQAGGIAIDDATGRSLASRAAALRRKASALRGPVLSGAERQRLLRFSDRRGG